MEAKRKKPRKDTHKSTKAKKKQGIFKKGDLMKKPPPATLPKKKPKENTWSGEQEES